MMNDVGSHDGRFGWLGMGRGGGGLASLVVCMNMMTLSGGWANSF